MSYDPASYDLAARFLPKDAPEASKDSLAQAIQDAVETWHESDDLPAVTNDNRN